MWNQIRNAASFGLQTLSHFALALQFSKQINNAQFSIVVHVIISVMYM
jgi:hypothetical protein